MAGSRARGRYPIQGKLGCGRSHGERKGRSLRGYETPALLQPPQRVAPRSADEFVEHGFQELLTTGLEPGYVAQGQRVLLAVREGGLAGRDLGADARIPGAVAILDEGIDAAVLADGSRDLQTAGEGVHARDMSDEQVVGLEALATNLGIEVHATGRETAVLQHGEHGLGRQVNVGWELIRVPAQEVIAHVGIDGPERSGSARDFEFMFHGLAGQPRVVDLDVEFEVLKQAVFPQEVQAGGRVAVILMARRLFGLGLNVERALKSNLLLVVDGHVHELPQVVQFALHVGVQQRRIPFASAPEYVALTAQLVGPFHGLLHLRCSETERVRVAARGRAVHVARMDEVLSRTPEQTDAGVFLELLQFVADRIELRIGLLEVLAVGAEVAVVPGVIGNAQLGGELEERTRPRDCVLGGALAGVPRALGGSPAEHVAAGAAHGVPINRGEAHMVAHRLALDHLIRIEMLEGQGILGIRTFVGDPADLGEELLAHVGLKKDAENYAPTQMMGSR